MNQKFVVVDLETTGNSVKKGDRIIQFAAVVIENGQIVEEFSSLLNPSQSIPIFIEELTGLTDEMVKDAPSFSDIAPKVMELLEDAYFVAHNVLFDLSFLQEELIMAGFEGFYGSVLDTVEMARVLFPTSDSFKLSDLALQENLEHDRPHQADSDAYVTAELLLLLFERLKKLPFKTLKQLYQLSHGLKSDLHEILEELLLEREHQVKEISYELEEYLGLYLKKKSEQYDIRDQKSSSYYPEKDDEKKALISTAFSEYEGRQEQLQMMDIVYKSFQKNEHALIEAGTGVGKSLGYLFPAAYFAMDVKQPIIISTNTTQLQSQLMQKEIPLLKKMLPFPFRAVLLKGKSHYISIEKFAGTLQENEDNYDTVLTKMQILVWLTETATGERDELNLSSGGQLFWERIKYTNDPVGKNVRRKHDFYCLNRDQIQKADLIITNHSLLLKDFDAPQKILPQSDYVIIDEGHHFQKVAGKQLGFQMDYASIRFLLYQMGTYEQKLLLYKVEKVLENNHLHSEGFLSLTRLNSLLLELIFEMDQLFKIIALVARKKRKQQSYAYSNSIHCPLIPDNTKEFHALMAGAERFLFLLTDFTNALKVRLESLQSKRTEKTIKQKVIMNELALWIETAEKLMKNIKGILLQSKEEHASWIEMDLRSWQNRTTLYSQPLSVAAILKEQLFQVKKSVIITSATLTVKESFRYIMNELGLEKKDCSVVKIPSPFHYEQQLQLVISNDLPEINSVSMDEYVSNIGEHIISIAEAAKGRLLVLFTSYEMLRKTVELIKESGFLQDYTLLAQGMSSGSRERLVRNFQRFDKAILFGTSSFWEGIDIPGEDLSCLIMVRLPFSPPDEPFSAAKCQEIKKRGGNPFYDYSLPDAVIRFKQGFGRLIRTRQDRGMIVIFDRRVLSAQYGKTFLNSLPPIEAKELNIHETVSLIHDWL